MPANSEIRVPKRQPVLDLKWSLMRKLALVALVCLVGAISLDVHQIEKETFQANRAVGESVRAYLELPFAFRKDTGDVAQRFRQGDAVFTQILVPGQCVRYFDNSGTVVASFCAGCTGCASYSTRVRYVQSWLVPYYSGSLANRLTYESLVTQGSDTIGKVVVIADSELVVSRIWADFSRLAGLTVAMIAALGVLVYFVVERALRPARDVIDGLGRLSAGDLTCRLPDFRLAELHMISDVFNELATTLEVTTAERASFARRLVEARDQERRHLARVLHDELAQSLSAMSATAASIKITARAEYPALAPEAQILSENASRIMMGLRRTLRELRLQEIDSVGLIASLEGLVADFNAHCGRRMRFFLEADSKINSASSAVAVSAFHIVKEGMTNAAKHARATRITATVSLAEHHATGTPELAISIEDDGAGMAPKPSSESSFGLGLIGIRERAIALGGRMEVNSSLGKGFKLRVTVPDSQVRLEA